MIQQTYEDWQQKLEACAMAAAGASGITYYPARMQPDTIVDFRAMVRAFLDDDHEAFTGDKNCWRTIGEVARALGIDKRKRLKWHMSSPCGIYLGAGDVRAFCLKQADDRWHANGTPPDVWVTGHPNHDSAIEHLERLLAGREADDMPLPVRT